MQFPAKIMLVLGLFVAVISEFVTMTMMVRGHHLLLCEQQMNGIGTRAQYSLSV